MPACVMVRFAKTQLVQTMNSDSLIFSTIRRYCGVVVMGKAYSPLPHMSR